VNEGDGTDVQACLVHMGRTGAVGLQSLCDHPQKDAQHHVQHRPIALHEVPQSLGHGEHPLAHRQSGNTWSVRCAAVSTRRRVVHEGRLPAFAGESDEVVVPTVTATYARKAVSKDAAFQILGKRLAHKGLGVWWSHWPSN
jgi:hypothetical protein